jgi:hypothetical protein
MTLDATVLEALPDRLRRRRSSGRDHLFLDADAGGHGAFVLQRWGIDRAARIDAGDAIRILRRRSGSCVYGTAGSGGRFAYTALCRA